MRLTYGAPRPYAPTREPLDRILERAHVPESALQPVSQPPNPQCVVQLFYCLAYDNDKDGTCTKDNTTHLATAVDWGNINNADEDQKHRS